MNANHRPLQPEAFGFENVSGADRSVRGELGPDPITRDAWGMSAVGEPNAGDSPRKHRRTGLAERLDQFVATAALDGPAVTGELSWVRHHNDMVRQSVKGSTDLTKRLIGEEDDQPLFSVGRWTKGTTLSPRMAGRRERPGSVVGAR